MTPVTVANRTVGTVLQCRLVQGQFQSSSAAETEAIGAGSRPALGARRRRADRGRARRGQDDVRAGRRAARSASPDPVTSPTFTIGQRYPAPVPVAHIDLFRVPGLADEDPDLLADYLRPGHDRVRGVAAGRRGGDRRLRPDRRPGSGSSTPAATGAWSSVE